MYYQYKITFYDHDGTYETMYGFVSADSYTNALKKLASYYVPNEEDIDAIYLEFVGDNGILELSPNTVNQAMKELGEGA